MMQRKRFFTPLLALSFSIALYSVASAVPYASSVRNTTGNTWEFVLNEAADNVTVLRNGANPVNLGALAAGRYTYDMTGFSTFDVKVSKNAASTWTTLYGAGNAFSNFTFPTGVAINTSPSNLAYFGTVYVANDRTGPTAAGRAMGDGIYALTANMVGVDLATAGFPAVADPNDATQAKAPNWDVTGNNSPWRMSLDASGNLIVADWSDVNGGIKWASRDLTTGGPLLKFQDGIAPLLTNVAPPGYPADFNGNGTVDAADYVLWRANNGLTGGATQAQGDANGDGNVDNADYDLWRGSFGNKFGEVHGSIAAKVYSTGSVGNNLVVYGMDEDQDSDGSTSNGNVGPSGNSIWKWNVGNLANTTGGDAGGYDQPPQLWIDATTIPRVTPITDNRQNFLNLNIGVSAGMHYDPVVNKWYLVEPRDAGDQGCVVVLNAPGDGTSTVAWSSLQFSIDNNLDGNPGFPTVPFGDSRDIQDMFRRVRDVSISPDHKWMALNRSVFTAALNGLGSGDVIIVPLDANGIPNIQVVAGQITNVITLDLVNNANAHGTGAQLEWDAAGNLYVADSGVTSQLVQVFSPGGNWIATTSSNGTFSLAPPGSGASLGSVPEPGTIGLAMLGLLIVGACRKTRQMRELV